ncbi:MAG: hypothetical protein IJP35_02760 [Clostridia bacterium]|nr:hypothetical protein [Clostridia bacterium]
MIFKKIRNRNLKANDAVLKRISGKPIRYAAARDENNVETILGKAGRIVLTDSQVQINCEGKVVYACDKKGVEISELISLGGARITGNCNGETKAVTVYFTYFNK